MGKHHTSRWTDFFRDSRDVFSAFTVISLLAGLTLVSAPLVCRICGWAVLSRDEMGALTLIYVTAALSDTLLGIYLNKAPDTVALVPLPLLEPTPPEPDTNEA